MEYRLPIAIKEHLGQPKLSTELQETISLVEVQALLVERFSEMKVADLFDEVKDLENNKAILDKQDFYLYFGDISYKGNKYPIFYLPINLVKLQDSFQLERMLLGITQNVIPEVLLRSF